MRSKNLDQKNNCGFNILTGDNRQTISVPYHERYNPIKSAGSQMMAPPMSSQSQKSYGGILPGMNY
jgi:hypothetical protein